MEPIIVVITCDLMRASQSQMADQMQVTYGAPMLPNAAIQGSVPIRIHERVKVFPAGARNGAAWRDPHEQLGVGTGFARTGSRRPGGILGGASGRDRFRGSRLETGCAAPREASMEGVVRDVTHLADNTTGGKIRLGRPGVPRVSSRSRQSGRSGFAHEKPQSGWVEVRDPAAHSSRYVFGAV